MNETFQVPSDSDMEIYLARARQERGKAFVQTFRWLWSLLHGRSGAHATPPKAAWSAR
jgi:hypothetical protein